ncbi:hypothetical protein [Azohydromonas lata]|uniref:hypothetical protein n=1 Tax=Azohydromonas lata TaxID=45677 RepID=UPI00082BCD0A|nr:hypothetical protein [Azohydromonas lata]
MTRTAIRTPRDVRARCEVRRGCHVWTGAVSRRGHPYASIDGRTQYVRRWLFEQLHGWVPRVVGLTCENLLCCNPKHLVAQDVCDVRRRAAANVAQPELRARRVALGRERAGLVKVNQAAADAIRASELPAKEEAKQWGISAKHVHQIRQGKRWPPQQQGALAMAAAVLLGSAL